MNVQTKNCQNCKQSFTIEPEDFEFYAKIKVPPPTFCPRCRLQRRLAFRNERALYKRACDLCKKDIIAMYPAKSPFTVYCPECFYSDNWNPLEYGREYDFSRPFFDQYMDLQKDTPHISLILRNGVNSPWINYEVDAKNCYLNFGGAMNEDSAYNQYLTKGKDCFDTFWQMGGEFTYENILCERSYQVFYSILCSDSQNTYFSFDCRNCSNVFGCSGLRNKQYQLFNKQVSKEEFDQFMTSRPFSTPAKLADVVQQAHEIWRSMPQRAAFIDKSVNVSGNLIRESKNCHPCWNADKMEDAKYQLFTLEVKDSMDATSVWGGELLYEFLAGAEQLSNLKFSVAALNGSTNVEYSNFVLGCHNIFGCMNLRSKSYCILNKQYSKEEYEAIVPKIIEHMSATPFTDKKVRVYRYGEFFPYDASRFGYQETVANQYFPLSTAEVEKAGFMLTSEEDKNYSFSDYTTPDDIKGVGEDILEKILKCEVSGKGFRLIPNELAFYRKFQIAIPRISPFERHARRLAFIAVHLDLHERACGRCKKPVQSVYSTEEFPKVYCQECYLAELI